MSKGEPQLWSVLNEKLDTLRQVDRISEAIPVAEKALEVARRAFIEIHPSLALAAERLGELYKVSGDLRRAEPLYWEAFHIYTELLPVDETALARLAGNLALICDGLGREDDAAYYYEVALPLVEKHYGPEHTELATMLNNLAMIYKNRGENGTAESHYLSALAIYEKVRGADHPDVAVMLNNLGVFYAATGNYSHAEGMHQRALGIRQSTYGPNHPDVAQSISNLAVVHHSQSEYKEAEGYYKTALAILQKHSRVDSEDYATISENYADLLRATGRERKAAQIQERAQAYKRR